MGDTWKNRIVSTGDEAPDQLLANPHNWRVHPKAQQDALAAVLDDVGWVQRVIVNRTTDHVVDGHLRVALALSRGEPTIPVSYVELDQREESLVLASLDPLAAMATTDQDKLRALLEQAEINDQTLRDALGAVAGLPAALPTAGLTDPDAIPSTRKTKIKRGDLFELGDHRLLCGDSTNADDVALVMGGEKADLCLTDPPYNVGRKYTPATKDRRHDYKEWSVAWFTLAEDTAKSVAFSCGHPNVVMWAGIKHWKWIICWYKPAAMLGSPFGVSNWEPVLFYGVGSSKGRDVVEASIVVDRKLDDHPLPKPIKFGLGFLELLSDNGAKVYDPFCGSGTTIIAAEQLGRKCFAIELEPSYCQVTIDRWEAFTGKTAKRVNHARKKTKANRRQKTKRQPRTTAAQHERTRGRARTPRVSGTS